MVKRKATVRWDWVLLFLFLLAFRTAFGLCLPFGPDPRDPWGEDALQTYLIGLRYATTGEWPYFGPDIYDPAAGVHDQIPGALEGLLIGLPLRLLPWPELPFLTLNLLSLGSLAFFAWYVAKRLPSLPFAFVLTWSALLPWSLHLSTNTLNPSYLLIGSLPFFIGFLEALPALSMGWLGVPLCAGLMGFGTFFCMQFHASWVLFLPFLLVSFLALRKGSKLPWIGGVLAGALLPFLCLLPTLLRSDPSSGVASLAARVASFNSDNCLGFFTILARYLSLACHELPRFLGVHTVDRIEYLRTSPWIIPPALLLTLAGWAEALLLLAYGFWRGAKDVTLRRVGLLTGAGFLLLWGVFCFTDRAPVSHLYYPLFPLPALYFFYIWDRCFTGKTGRLLAGVLLLASLWFQAGALGRASRDQTFFTYREKVSQALATKDPRVLGERRSGSLY